MQIVPPPGLGCSDLAVHGTDLLELMQIELIWQLKHAKACKQTAVFG